MRRQIYLKSTCSHAWLDKYQTDKFWIVNFNLASVPACSLSFSEKASLIFTDYFLIVIRYYPDISRGRQDTHPHTNTHVINWRFQHKRVNCLVCWILDSSGPSLQEAITLVWNHSAESSNSGKLESRSKEHSEVRSETKYLKKLKPNHITDGEILKKHSKHRISHPVGHTEGNLARWFARYFALCLSLFLRN